MTTPDRRCAVFWTGGHLCLSGLVGHAGEHACANPRCVDIHDAPEIWGADAGELRRGRMPADGSDVQPSRGLTGRTS